MKDPFESIEDTVELRVANALTFLINEHPGQNISISKVCRVAEVSRANLYTSHPGLVDKIHALNKKNGVLKKAVASEESTGVSTEDTKESSFVSTEDVKLLRKRIKTLTLVCIELKLKNEELLSRLAVLQRQVQDKRRSVQDEGSDSEKRPNKKNLDV